MPSSHRIHRLPALPLLGYCALAMPAVTITPDQLFDWAQGHYPTLFPAGSVSFPWVDAGVHYTLRHYPGTGNYLGVADDGGVYALGDFTANRIQGLGPLSAFACQVAPGRCVGSNPLASGPLYACADAQWNDHPDGFHITIRYRRSGYADDELVDDTVTEGMTVFEGQNVRQITELMTYTRQVNGQTQTATNRSTRYEVRLDGGHYLSAGSIVESSGPAGQSTARQVYQPLMPHPERSLGIGQSVTVSAIKTVTPLVPAGQPPSDAPVQTMTTFEARETIAVQGRSFDTCRLRIVDATSPSTYTLVWMLPGKGVAAKWIAVRPGAIQLVEMLSGSFGGVPL
ncbi:hypothetical protein [Aquabacterium sp.]|uniref:hypothetical protein n=1 Tax=Aquabacterium sp. TaxID=1872578 RepID=UPI00378506E3